MTIFTCIFVNIFYGMSTMLYHQYNECDAQKSDLYSIIFYLQMINLCFLSNILRIF